MGAPQFEQAGADISGTGTTNTIPRWTGPSTLGDSGLIDNGTAIYTTTRNVGFGTASPSTRLHVSDNSSIPVIVQSSGSTDSYLRFINTSNNLGYIGYVGTSLYLAPNNGAGNVGIGTASPSAKVHSVIADGATYSYGASGTTKGLRVEHSAAETRIVGVDNTLNVSYQPLVLGGSTLGFNTGGTTRALTIDATQQVGIGTASPGALLHLEKALGLTANAEIFRLRNSTVGSGSNVSQTFYVHGNSVATGNISHAWNGTTYDTIFSVWNGSALAEAGRALGGSTPVLSVPSGLKLPATPGNADTQTLDCYQENSWTPTLSAAATWGGTAPTVNFANYTRVGRLIFFEIELTPTAATAFSATWGSTSFALPVSAPRSTAIAVNRNAASANAVTSGANLLLPTFALVAENMRVSGVYAI